jgi:glycogen debranching enzyme
VEPALSIKGQDLPLSGLAIQSVIGKWMGPVSEWPKFFEVFADKGYNMIHFTPLNQRGDSNSPYSIYDQLAFSADLFEGTPTKEEQYKQIKKLTTMMERKYGLLSLVDVVWNHTAENSDWLQDHPEAAFNLHNSPHLIAPYELDSALLEFSKNLRTLGYPTVLSNDNDLLKIMDGVKTHVLGGLRLWEFYVVEVVSAVSSGINAWKKGKYIPELFDDIELSKLTLPQKARSIAKKGLDGSAMLGQRFEKTIRPDIGAAYLTAIYGAYDETNLSTAQRDLTGIINEINLPLYKDFDADREAILENVYNRVKYVRLDLKEGEITEE